MKSEIHEGEFDTRSVSVNDAVMCKNLVKTFGTRKQTRALNGVSIAISRGECLAVVGESGSGKSTLARILVGMETADSGEVWVQGRRLHHRVNRAELRRRAEDMQMVFQDPSGSLNRALPVWTAIDEVLQVHSTLNRAQRRKRAEDLFADVGLDTEFLASRPAELSGGQKQRVAIARALAANPRIIVFDEAVSALDVTVQAQVLELLGRLKTEYELTYLFITHDLSVVRLIADSVVVMRRGSIVEQGDAEQVLRTPQHAYTKLLLACAPRPGWRPERGVIVKYRQLSSREAAESDEKGVQRG